MTEEINPDFSKGDGLVPAVVQNVADGVVLMLGYMNREAYERTRESGRVHFFSRSRKSLWMKGETSGNVLDVVSMRIDCDSDTLLVLARPQGPTCHTGTSSCFGDLSGWSPAFLMELEKLIALRKQGTGEKSYVSSLFQLGTKKIAQKVSEEAGEVVIEAVAGDKDLFSEEAADLLFHFLVLLADQGFSLQDIAAILEQRHQQRAAGA